MMQLPQKRFGLSDEKREAYETRMTLLRERWQIIEDFAEQIADRCQTGWNWLCARPLLLRWATVFLSVTVSMVVGLALHDNVAAASQLLLFLPAVLLSALYGGQFAGLVAALLGAVATVHWKMSGVTGSFEPSLVALFLYAIACCIVLGLSNAQANQQRQILRFTETLEERIQERTADLEKANEELSGFCYSISHDLRAPMRNIVGSSRILLEEAGPRLDEDSRQRLTGLAGSAMKLSTWVDDLLNHARLGHMEIKPEWIDLTKMIDELCSQLQTESWKFSSFTANIQPNLVITGDRVLVRLAIRNILENACKYAKEGLPLQLEIGERRISRKTFVYIRDNGIGFEQKYADKIFEPFERLHRDEDYEGSGIGLANVAAIIARHDGEILAESKPNEGSTFLIRFGTGKKRS